MRYDSPGVRYDAGFRYDSPDEPSKVKMKAVKLGLSEKSWVELASQGVSIKAAMTGNANFSSPNPTLAVFSGKITDLQAAITARDNAVEAAKAATEALHAAAAAYKVSITQLAAYAENV